jgi:hypothetical protein
LAFEGGDEVEVFEVNTIIDDSKGPPDRKSDTWSQNISFLGDLSDFEVFEANTIVDDSKGRPIEKVTPGAKTSYFWVMQIFSPGRAGRARGAFQG